jgi:hypothetical protein
MPAEHVLETKRPEPTAADDQYWLKVTSPTGPVIKGVVVSVSPELGTGYVRASESGALYLLARKVLHKAFDSLKAGAEVKFRENGHHAVASLQV